MSWPEEKKKRTGKEVTWHIFKEASPGTLDIIKQIVKENPAKYEYRIEETCISREGETYKIWVNAIDANWFDFLFEEFRMLYYSAKMQNRILLLIAQNEEMGAT